MTDTKNTGSVAAQLAALPNLPMPELWALWDRHFPRRPSHHNRDYVESRIAYRIQELAYGGLPAGLRRPIWWTPDLCTPRSRPPPGAAANWR